MVENNEQPNLVVLKMMSEAPVGQLDSSMAKYIENLLDKSKQEIIDGLAHVLDESVKFSLASGFVISVLDSEYNRLTK